MVDLEHAFRLLTPEALSGLAGLAPPFLRASAEQPERTPDARDADAAVGVDIEGAGHARLVELVEPDRTTQLTQALVQMLAAGLPAVAVYGLPSTWTVGERLRARVSAALGEPYLLLDDTWAFHIAPGTSGWAPHRGAYQRLNRRRPEVLNTWVAISDAPVNRSCLHFVALDADARYPDDLALARVGRPDAAPDRFVPAPLLAGDALVWNANALHTGGPCAPDAPGPRLSITFTLARADACARAPGAPHATAFGVRVIDPGALEPWDRIEHVARQVVTYGDGQTDVSDGVRAWARATTALRGKVAQARPPT
jgi:hypothetical protein